MKLVATHQSMITRQKRVEIDRDNRTDVQSPQSLCVVCFVLYRVFDPANGVVPARFRASREFSVEIRFGGGVERRRALFDSEVVFEISLIIRDQSFMRQRGADVTHFRTRCAVCDVEVCDVVGLVRER